MRKLGILVAAIATTTSTAAEAATFSVVPTWRPTFASMTYRAAPGERNRMTATFDLVSREFVLTDPGAHAIVPLPTSQNDITLSACKFELRRVTCVFPSGEYPAPYPTGYMWAELGDGDDTLTMDMEGRVDGGLGSDRITSTASADVPFYYGGVEMVGGDGADRLIGGGGDDSLFGDAGADTLDGREGQDTAGWGAESSVPVAAAALGAPEGGVHVTLDGLPNDGHRGGLEGDNALDVERLHGTEYADVIVGGAADEWVYAYGGDDHVVGGAGKDVVDSGSGDDRIELRDGEPDRYSCGDGADVLLADPFDSRYWQSTDDCETITVEG